MGLFGGSSDVSSASSQAVGGLGAFSPENYISLGNPIFNLKKPSQIVGFAVVCAVAWVGYKRIIK